MMDFRLVCARLLVSTYGPKFNPSTQPATPPTLAQSMKDGPTIQSALDSVRQTWQAKGIADASAAIAQVRMDAATQIGTRLKATVALADPVSSYIPVVDPSGVATGHEVCAWVYVDGSPLTEEFVDANGQLVLGAVACVLLAVEQT